MRKTLLILATSLNVACATIVACRGEIGDYVPVFGFDLNQNRLYLGKKDDPKETLQLNSPELETEWVALRLSSWRAVKDRLATCK